MQANTLEQQEQSAKAEDLHGDRALTVVEESERKSFWETATVTAGFCIAMSGMFAGAAISTGLTLWQTVIAVLIGNGILAIYGGFVGAAGAKHGVSTTMLTRHAFGRNGSVLIAVIWGLTLIGWFSVQTGFFGVTIESMFPNGGILTSSAVASLWGGLLMMLTAYYGFKGLSLLSKLAVPALFILCIWGITSAVSNSEGGWAGLFQFTPSDPKLLTHGIVLAVGSYAVGAVIQADISRYAKKVSHSWLAIIFGTVIANSFVIIAGAITTMATQSGDLPKSMLALGLGIPALLVLVLAQWTSNDSNLYSASLAFSNIFKVKKARIVVVCGIIATLIGVMGIANYFTSWLLVLGVTIPPIAGIIISDYYFVKKQQYQFGPGTEYAKIVWPAFVAWGVASILGYFIQWGIPSLNSIIIALILHFALMKICEAAKLDVNVGRRIEDHSGF